MEKVKKNYHLYHKEEYFIRNGILTIPKKYRSDFIDYVDVVILPSGLLLYPHNGKNNDKVRVIKRKLSKTGQFAVPEKEVLKFWGDLPESFTMIEHKKGVFAIPVFFKKK